MGESPPALEAAPSRSSDFVNLTKAKLSLLVVCTTGAGFVSARAPGADFDFFRMMHTLLGTTSAAFGAAVFNQLLEADADRRMKRTEDRPVAAGRIPTAAAFGIGWLLSAFGIVHLGVMVNVAAALLAGLTLVLYIFAYTPLKRRSETNTLVGAVCGAIPPMIGWTAAGGDLADSGAWWWFGLLFLWQLPHFYAINWIHREEYMRAGFVMLANKDDSGVRTSRWSLVAAAALMVLVVGAPVMEVTRWWFVIPGGLLSFWLLRQAWLFRRERTPDLARSLFFVTLGYLPLLMLFALLADRAG